MKLKGIILVLIATLGVAGISCESKSPAISVTHLKAERQIGLEHMDLYVKISGEYPQTGNPKLLSASRTWIAEQLAHAKSNEQPLFAISPELLEDEQMLLKRSINALRENSGLDLIDISFKPTYNTDKLLTYVFSKYTYSYGGTHGVSNQKVQTFVAATGEKLTNENTFRPDKKVELIALIKDGLLEQYFRKLTSYESLGYALNISADDLDLPVCDPQFGADGITFTYQAYEIAAYCYGQPTCSIPYADLMPMLAPQIVDLLQN